MKAGFLGVGNMGLPMAGKILDAGHELAVCDVREEAMRPLLERQARRAASPKELADTCEIVFVSLPTLKILRDVVLAPGGLIDGKEMKLLVNTCTVGVPMIKEVEAAMKARGIGVVDCPISGGPAGAQAGTLAVMVSGAPELIERMRPLVSKWGKTFVVAGDEPGAAQVLKLTNNIMFAVNLVLTAEAMVMGTKGGVRPEVLMEAINAGSGRNAAMAMVMPNAVLPRTFDFGCPLHILMKDVDLAVELGEELGVPMWVCQAARLVYKHAMFQGRADTDISRMVEIVENGADFRIPQVNG
ncbi:MAG: NAD(P)-dependent oxidoreductase [Hyphomicrobiaceae bacterium]